MPSVLMAQEAVSREPVPVHPTLTPSVDDDIYFTIRNAGSWCFDRSGLQTISNPKLREPGSHELQDEHSS